MSGDGRGRGAVCAQQSTWEGSITGASGAGAFSATTESPSGSRGPRPAIPKSTSSSFLHLSSHTQVSANAEPYTGSSFSLTFTVLFLFSFSSRLSVAVPA